MKVKTSTGRLSFSSCLRSTASVTNAIDVRRLRRLVLIAAATGAASGCGGGDGPVQPPAANTPVLSSVEVPASVLLFSTAPGNTVTMSVTPKDQNGNTLSTSTSKSFSSSNAAVATVSGDGRITAVAVGTAQVTVAVTSGAVTRSATTTAEVKAPPATALIIAPSVGFQPAEVHVSSGGQVTWTFETLRHNVTFTTPGSPESLPDFVQGSESRTFPTRGSFDFLCSLHAGMTGKVHVH